MQIIKIDSIYYVTLIQYHMVNLINQVFIVVNSNSDHVNSVIIL